jgi:hypothetical protein
VTEHERRYPNGLLVQEREVMAVRALALLGRSEEAHARADRFRSRFPSSLLLPALGVRSPFASEAMIKVARRPK